MLRQAVLIVACFCAAAPASAHHSAAATYDADHPLALTGTVSEFAWRNPHCFLYVDISAGPFQGQRYVVEMSSLVVLASQGWTRRTLKTGDRVSLQVLPARTGRAAGLCRNCEIHINGAVTKA